MQSVFSKVLVNTIVFIPLVMIARAFLSQEGSFVENIADGWQHALLMGAIYAAILAVYYTIKQPKSK